jgi:hypothetical protein
MKTLIAIGCAVFCAVAAQAETWLKPHSEYISGYIGDFARWHKESGPLFNRISVVDVKRSDDDGAFYACVSFPEYPGLVVVTRATNILTTYSGSVDVYTGEMTEEQARRLANGQ